MWISGVVKHSRASLRMRSNLLAARLYLSTGSSAQRADTPDATQQTLYELRTYTVYPEKMREFLKVTAEEFHLRMAHSKLLGYWTAEIGGLNQVVHIWEYDSLSHRAGVRARLAGDPEWLSRYVGRVVSMWQHQDNLLLTLLPGTALNIPAGKGVYELQTLQLQGAPAVWFGALVGYVRACEGAAGDRSWLVGAWRSALGPRHTAALLWQHQEPDGCLSLRDASDSLDDGVALSCHVTSGHSKLLLPQGFSGLQ